MGQAHPDTLTSMANLATKIALLVERQFQPRGNVHVGPGGVVNVGSEQVADVVAGRVEKGNGRAHVVLPETARQTAILSIIA